MAGQWSNYKPQKISVELIRKLASADPPAAPHDIRDRAAKLILRHQKTGYLGLYVSLGRDKRKQICDARHVIDEHSSWTLGRVKNDAFKLLAQHKDGKDFSAELKAQRAIPTLNEYLKDTYGPWALQNRRSGQATLDRITACFADEFGADKLNSITAVRVEQWASARQRNGVSSETINRDVGALRPALQRAVKLKLISANPLADYERLEVDKSKRVRRAFTAAEELQLRVALEARDEKKGEERRSANEWRKARNVEELPSLAGLYADTLTPSVLVSLETGLRRNELFTLEWPNVDFAEKIVRVEGKTAKSFQTREVPLNAAALSVLRRWWLQLGQPKTGAVFMAGDEPLKNLRKSFAVVLKAAGIKNTKAGRVSWHSLRHSFGTRLGAAGVDAATLRDLLGHADLAVTNRYIHSDADRKRAAVELVADRD